MKQNSIFFYVKRNNNNSESMVQCSSNVKEAPNPSGPNVIQLPALENGMTYI